MANGNWQIGLHIQADNANAVALSRWRGDWQLRRWWQIPLGDACRYAGATSDSAQLVTALRSWRAEIPRQHQLAIAFPAGRTLQHEITPPAAMLRESECESWVGAVTARHLQLEPQALCLDYHTTPQGQLLVTAAHRQEVDALRVCARQLKLSLQRVTPDACALRACFPFLTPQQHVVAWDDGQRWLWATRERWGCSEQPGYPGIIALCQQLDLPASALAISGTPPEGISPDQRVDPWRWLTRLQPPLPDDTTAYTIALALALSGGTACSRW